MTCKNRWSDKLPIKITKSMLWSIVLLLWGIVIWFVKDKYNDMDIIDRANAESVQSLDKRMTVVEATLPRIEKGVNQLLRIQLRK